MVAVSELEGAGSLPGVVLDAFSAGDCSSVHEALGLAPSLQWACLDTLLAVATSFLVLLSGLRHLLVVRGDGGLDGWAAGVGDFDFLSVKQLVQLGGDWEVFPEDGEESSSLVLTLLE